MMEIYDGNMESNWELRSVSLAAPLCLLAVAWVARSSKKPLKRPAAKLQWLQLEGAHCNL